MNLLIDFSKDQDKRKLFKTLKMLKPVRYSIELKQFRKSRSNPQNAFYWGVVVALLSQHTGFTPDEMHDLLKLKFNPQHKALPTGEEVRIGGSTTKMDTLKMNEYIEQIRIWAVQELDCLIPEPNEVIC